MRLEFPALVQPNAKVCSFLMEGINKLSLTKHYHMPCKPKHLAFSLVDTTANSPKINQCSHHEQCNNHEIKIRKPFQEITSLHLQYDLMMYPHRTQRFSERLLSPTKHKFDPQSLWEYGYLYRVHICSRKCTLYVRLAPCVRQEQTLVEYSAHRRCKHCQAPHKPLPVHWVKTHMSLPKNKLVWLHVSFGLSKHSKQ